MDSGNGHQKFFFLLLFVVTLGLCWILSPFSGMVFQGVILAILFRPVQRTLIARMGKRPDLAALITLTLTTFIMTLPVISATATIVQKIGVTYQQIQGARPNYSRYLSEAVQALPTQVRQLLAKAGLTNIAGTQKKLAGGAAQISQFAVTKALSIGQDTFQFVMGFGVMLYMVSLLPCDGTDISRHVHRALSMDGKHKHLLLNRFTTVVCTTVKGNIAVALVQGVLGELAFWFLGIDGVMLWGALMAFLSLLPTIGASLIWIPVAFYFLMVGVIWKCAILVAFCGGAIGLIDSLLRLLLVGEDTKIPDWVVLISTLDGMELFGTTGFMIEPLVAALLMASWDIFTREQSE